ncbi:MAG: hypothetical protein E7299_01030 [Lachnospiraceae bacterium]|nr:hypothetical protein [Lachnospiraceae bacterium]
MLKNTFIKWKIRKNKTINNIQGFYTVEAAMLMPMLLLLFFFLFYIGIYQYDRCVTEQAVKQVLIRASNKEADETELELFLLERCHQPFLAYISADIVREANEAKASFVGGIRTLLGDFGEGILPAFWLVYTEHSVDIYKPVEFIRDVRRVEEYVRNGFCE